MATLSTTWTQRDYTAFTAGTLSTITDCVGQVEANLHRGTLSASSSPTSTQVQNFLIWGKQKLAEKYKFTWRRKFVYASTAAGTWQYALPADFGGGGTTLRDITNDKKLDHYDPATFNASFVDPAGESQKTPAEYTIKDRELQLSAPANGTYTLELEFTRTGDDSTPTDISWLPETARFHICDYATYRSFLMIQNWEAASMFKAEWMEEVIDAKKGNSHQKWSAMGYMAKNWHYVK